MPGVINLGQFHRGWVRVNDDFVTASIEMSELSYMLRGPKQRWDHLESFYVKGKEKTVLVKHEDTVFND